MRPLDDEQRNGELVSGESGTSHEGSGESGESHAGAGIRRLDPGYTDSRRVTIIPRERPVFGQG